MDELREQARVREEERRQAAAQAEASARQRDLLAVQQGQDQLRDAHDEIAEGIGNGTVPKEQAEQAWQDRAKQILADTTPKVRPQAQDLATRELDGLQARLGNGVRKTVLKRDQSDIQAGIDQTLEYQARQYGTDPAKASAMVEATLRELGPFSGLSPEQLQRKGQVWRESTEYTQGFEAVSGARNSRPGLDQAEKLVNGGLPNIDPQKKATLNDRIQAYRLSLDQKDEMAAARRQREAETRLKNAEAAYNVFVSQADKGTMLDPAYIDSAIQVTAGTPYQNGIVAMAKQAQESGGLAAQPVPVQRQMLTELDGEIARNGRNPALDKRRQQLEKVLQGSEQDLQRDPLRAGLERGVITQLPPLQLQGGLEGIIPQLTTRVQQADRVGTWAGRPVAPFTSDEAQNVARFIRTQPPEQRARSIQALAQVMPPRQAQALAALMDKEDRPLAIAFGLGASRTTFDRPVAELVLKGATALENKTIKEDKTPVDGWMGRINATIAGVYGNTEQTSMVSDAARYILAGKVAEGAAGSDGDVRTAIDLAVGGKLSDVNGTQVVIPAGVQRKDFDARMRQYPPDDLAKQLPDGKVYVRGQPMDLQVFLNGLPSAQLRTVGSGRYAVVGGGSIATNAQGKPIVVEVPNAR
ncbi:hypothetical protein CDN99_06660 [Roseateles aquatilis]|uniref:Uncharacterized protein n=2 Tax=Roseateles aquatilis TaxID=431061 RepID=A0A246JHD5_9BURK|nr:hypothetical protein CDN99_06660 [Roseateles aquatilis]